MYTVYNAGGLYQSVLSRCMSSLPAYRMFPMPHAEHAPCPMKERGGPREGDIIDLRLHGAISAP